MPLIDLIVSLQMDNDALNRFFKTARKPEHSQMLQEALEQLRRAERHFTSVTADIIAEGLQTQTRGK